MVHQNKTSMVVKKTEPQIRFLSEMKSVLYDQKWAKTAPSLEVYYIWRGVKKKDDLRYDITVIPPQTLGQEFPKTKGHRHSNQYQEVYEVLGGKVIFLAQKFKKNLIEDVYAIRAKRGEIIIVPPGYDHLLINPSKKKLKIANWVSEKCQNIYDLFERLQGACYYYTKRGWIKNKNYAKIPKLRIKKPLKSKPKNLDFLKNGSN